MTHELLQTMPTEEVIPTSVDDVIKVIDEGFGLVTGREIVSTSEVADLLLDIRSALTSKTRS